MATRLLSLRGMALERLALEAGGETAWDPPATERFLYVIAGEGSARVGSKALPLAHESVLWLEPGERAELSAGEDGLELLGVTGPA
jgi:quercetin dioxygenase-like cupin family protein